MLDIGWSEMAVIALLALIVIGPKDLPRVMRTMGKWAHKARAVSREFQSGIDEMIREADLQDAKKALDSTRTIGLDKVVEDTIDPTGTIKQEAQELESSARNTGTSSAGTSSAGAANTSSGTSGDQPAASASEPSANETPAETAPSGAESETLADETRQKSA